jgi:Lipoprotein LpqB beta-propeller domain/Sporulation and spore germination
VTGTSGKADRGHCTVAVGLRRGAAARMAASAAAMAALAGGCATMPETGPVQQFPVGQGGSGQAQDNPQPIPVPPGPGWRADEIVSGFLAASASFTNDHAIARDYLTPAARTAWRPGWAATVVGPAPKVHIVTPPRNVMPGGHLSYTVRFTGQRLAALTNSGQYVTSSGSREADTFTLVRIDGQWRISHLPSPTSLILTKPDFQRDYEPRNLYFFAPSGDLVPDPVFVPQQANNADPANGLVEALLKNPTGLLSWATRTAFPAGTKPLGRVKIIGNGVVVDLGGAAAKASPRVVREMAAQLVWTLAGTSYSTPAIKSVTLEINHVVKYLHGEQLQLLTLYSSLMPTRPAGGAYFLSSSSGGVRVLPGDGQSARQVVWPSGISRLAFSMIAVSPGEGQIAGIVPGQKGCMVYSGALLHGARLTGRQLSSGTCTSLSWDNQGDIWAASGTHVWMLPPGGGAAVPVFLPGASALAGPSASLPAPDSIAALRIAPDGIRVAMIVRSRTGPAQVFLGAISHTGRGQAERTYIERGGLLVSIGADVSGPSALSWYDADHVLVLGQAHGPLLYDVPLTGGTSAPIITAPGTTSITAAGSDLLAGTSSDQILMSSGQVPSWRLVGLGRAPAYSG